MNPVHTLLLLASFLIITHPSLGYDVYGNRNSHSGMRALKKLQEQAKKTPRYTVGEPDGYQNSTLIEDAGFTRQSSIDAALEDVRRREEEHARQSATRQEERKKWLAERMKELGSQEESEALPQPIEKEQNKAVDESDKQEQESKGASPLAIIKAAIAFILVVASLTAFILGWIWLEENWLKLFESIGSIIYHATKKILLLFKPAYLATTIPCILLLLALADMPYWYYTLLRVIVCACSISVLLTTKHNISRTLYIGLALLYNPIAPVHLDRDIWAPINLATAAIIITLHIIRSRLPEKQ